MYKSISYLEISCKYNRSELCRFCGAVQYASANRKFSFRNHFYFIAYDADRDEFRIFNSKGLLVANVIGDSFQYYVTSAPEIGIDLIFGFLAVLNIYPIKK